MKSIAFLSVLFSILFIAGCGNKPTLTIEPTPIIEQNSTSTEADFTAFWTAFRNAVKENKLDEIRKRTSFPIKTRGVMDEDPIVTFSESEFDAMFNVFLQSPTGLNPNNFNETQKQYIEANQTITFNEYKVPMMPDSSTANITSMEFKKGIDGWKLTFLYLDEEAYSKSGKMATSEK